MRIMLAIAFSLVEIMGDKYVNLKDLENGKFDEIVLIVSDDAYVKCFTLCTPYLLLSKGKFKECFDVCFSKEMEKLYGGEKND